MSKISENAIKLINDLRRDISIDIMFTPEKNAEDDSLKQLVDYIAELEGENAGLKEELQQEKTRSQLNLEAEERRMLNITYYCAEIDRLNARIAELEALVERLIEAGNWLNAMHEDGVFVDELNAARTSWKLAVSDWQSMPSHVTNPLDSQGIVTRNGGEG